MVESLPSNLVQRLVASTLTEDLGTGGDVTTDAIVAPDTRARAELVARQAGTIAGIQLAIAAFTQVDERIEVECRASDGDRVSAGDVVLSVHGPARGILTAERTALNFLGHLSGIATATRRFVDRTAGTGVAITDTRKTMPGLRAVEKYAVRCGGGTNHRFGLDDAVLIKDNHLALAPSIEEAVAAVRRHIGDTLTVEVEVETLDQLEAALAAGADAVLLDNMGLADLSKAVEIAAGRARLEASGGVTAATVSAIANTGVDAISAGWLTHSAPALDLSLDFHPQR